MGKQGIDIAEKPEKRTFPKVRELEDGTPEVRIHSDDELQILYGVGSKEVGTGLMMAALNSLGVRGERYREMMVAMASDLEPQDAIEAMLISQMTATHVAMSVASQRMNDSDTLQHYEVYERAVTRMGRTYIGQMEALKKYRAKAQQTVRVERVTVEDGGQAIVGTIETRGGGK